MGSSSGVRVTGMAHGKVRFCRDTDWHSLKGMTDTGSGGMELI